MLTIIREKVPRDMNNKFLNHQNTPAYIVYTDPELNFLFKKYF